MTKHKENKIWMLRKDGESNGYVKTIDNKTLQIYYYSDINNTNTITNFTLNRQDARALAKRILECLDNTK